MPYIDVNFVHSASIKMRDLIKKYKKIVKGKSDSESDAESQPLMSSSSTSSTKSFGTVFKNSETELSDNEDVKGCEKLRFSSMLPSTPTFPQKPRANTFLYSPNSTPLDAANYDDSIFEKYPGMKNPVQPEDNHKVMKPNGIGYEDLEAPKSSEPKNPSIITIFAVWNTCLGSSLLAISWGLEKTGLVPGIIINLALAGICVYMAYLLLKVNEKHSIAGQRCEVPELCNLLLGKWAEILAKIFSLIVLIGANIVYWILMSNFLYNLVSSLYGFLNDRAPPKNMSVICLKELGLNATVIIQPLTNLDTSYFNRVWDLYSTVPVILGFMIFPILNFKSANIFLKFNSLGTISVVYLMGFTLIKSISWGINLPDVSTIFTMKPTFAVLSGMLTLSYFLHNIIISIMKNNKNQQNNGRDMTIAFGLVTFTYTFIGVLFFISFPLAKFCIEDNFFNNFDKYDILVIMGRLLLLFQLCTVFPLMSFMLRNEIFSIMRMFIAKNVDQGFKYGPVVCLNLILVIICILFACFLPRIGTLIRYTGALSGLVYVFMLPNLLYIYSLKKENKLTTTRLFCHIIIIILGFINLLSQFIINDE